MPQHRDKRILPFTPEQMFDLVIAVEHYPEFLPWCVATRINSRGENEMSADMAVGFKGFNEKYTSHITFERPGHLHVTDKNGPFKKLETDWRFTPADGGVEVDFEIDFEFSSSLLESIMGRVFTEAADKMVDAFVRRAEKVYSP